MHWNHALPSTVLASALAAGALIAAPSAIAQLNNGQPQVLSTGQRITPLVPRGASYVQLNPGLAKAPDYTVGQTVSTVVSPDHKTLLILTSGYNLWSYASGGGSNSEFVFVFDISSGNAVQKQAIPVPNTYSGIVFNPNGKEFYVAGGKDDNVHLYAPVNGVRTEEANSPIALGHLANANSATGNYGGLGLETDPAAAGIAVTQDGTKLVVADYENDAISVLTAGKSGWTKTGELDLRPGVEDRANATGTPGGEYPFWICIKANGTAYISSIRDRQIVIADISGTPVVTSRIKLDGQPNKMVLNAAQTRLYVAQDNSDSVAVIDTTSNSMFDEIKVTAPVSVYPNKKNYKGANPNDVVLSPDEKTLYVSNGGENAIAVVSLSGVAGNSYVAGLIPTGFYPNSLSTSSDGKLLYIVNGKSANGPNPQFCDTSVSTAPSTIACDTSNQYDLQITKGGFQTLPTPTAGELSNLTEDVIANDHFLRTLTPDQQSTMAALHANIHHIIYIVKENRTYDQILGDLEVGNGDPSIVQFPEANTPNFHAFARNFVDLDNFYDTSNVSFDGWAWSTSARTTDVVEKEYTVNYAGRGVSYDSEGTNRNVNVGYADLSKRQAADPLIGTDPNLLPGGGNVAAPDSAEGGQGEGYLWNAALKAGLTVRDYGFFIDLARYNLPAPYTSLSIPEDITPYADKVQVAYSSNRVLRKYTDKYFRGFDNTFPDYYRFTEWQREFNQYVSNGNLPNLTLLRLMHDHFGNFTTALNGVNTPEVEIADNDYAVGLVADAVAHSPYKNDTLIFVIEDDSQDGGDHVDAHRSTAFIIGPYVKQNFVDPTRYNTVSMLRTMEDILGMPHLNLNDASSVPMANAFDLKQTTWNYTATPSAYLQQTTLPIDPSKFANTANMIWHPLHNAAWWAQQTKGMDFSVEDHLDTPKFNRILWEGTMGSRPYPTFRSGIDLRSNRAQLLKEFDHARQSETQSENHGSAANHSGGAAN